MSTPARFCIRSVSPEERRALEAVGVRPHDCISACTDCFHQPVISQGDERVDEQAVRALLERGRAILAAEPDAT